MKLTRTTFWILPGAIAFGTFIAALVGSCTGQGPPRPTCADVAGFDGGNDVDPYTLVLPDGQPPEAFGQEVDPGPQCTDCTQDRDLEILTVVDFENGFAPAWFNYGEPGIFLEPPAAGPAINDAGMANNLPPPYWGLQAEPLTEKPGGARCGSEYALHMAGDRFSSWGGGFVTRLVLLRGDELIDQFCTPGYSENALSSVDGGNPDVNGIGGTPRYMANGTADGFEVSRDDASGCFFYISPAASQPSWLGLDVSDYDGISFWARRGPSGQSTLRVALVDQDTSEDWALQVERDYWLAEKDKDPEAVVDPNKAGAACRRVKGCCRHCSEELTFEEWVAAGRLDVGDDGTVDTGSGMVDAGIDDAGKNHDPFIRSSTQDRCWVEGEPLPTFQRGIKPGAMTAIYYGWDFRDPTCGLAPPPEELDDVTHRCWFAPAQEIWDQWNRDHALCCPRTMEEEQMDPVEANGDPRYGAPTGLDAGIEDTRCRPYVFNYDQSSGNYCYAPGEVLPEKNQNRCGEGFESAVTVDTEWKLFTIPWRELRRFTPDKPPIDPNSIWMLSFYFNSGYLDTYIDDIGFYKKRPRDDGMGGARSNE